MEDLVVTAAAGDRRVVLPSLLVADLGLSLADAEVLADEVSELVADDQSLVGRPLWRQSYTERLAGSGEQRILLSRWPVEGTPVVTVIDGETVDASLYSATGSGRHALYRESRWLSVPSVADPLTGAPRWPARQLYYSVAYTAGYLMPGQVATWSSSQVWGVGQSAAYSDSGAGWARSTVRSNQLRFEVTAGSGAVATQPTWPTTVGDTVTASGVTFTARTAVDLPAWASSAMRGLAEIVNDRQNLDLKREKFGSVEFEYDSQGSSPWGRLSQKLAGLK